MEKIFKELEIWYKKYIKIFFAILLIGILTHTFVLTNKLINHDELCCLFSKGASYELGRWGLEIIKYILPNISMPWYNGIITLILISISACIILEIFDIKNKIFQIIIGGIMITFPSITATFSYMFTASSYAVAIFLSVLSVYIISKKNYKIDFIGVLCLVFSISLYQAYVSLSASLIIILLIKECLKKENNFKEIIKVAIRYCIFFIVSLGLYFILTKIINKYKIIQFSSYQGTDKMGQFSIIGIIKGILKSYKVIIDIYFTGWNGIIYNKILKIIYIILGIIDTITILLIVNKARKIKILRGLLIFVLAIMLPMTMNLLFIINSQVDMHALMTYGNLVIFILPFLLYDEIKNIKYVKYIKYISIILAFITIFEYSKLANECYTKMYLAYEQTYSFYSTLITRIENTEGFNNNTKIALVGNYNGQLSTDLDEFFVNTQNVTGVLNANALINSYAKTNFIKDYLGINFNLLTDNEIEQIKELPEYKEMNTYPYENSIKVIDNILIVKYE